MDNNKRLKYFLIFAFIYCAVCCLIFEPITWQAVGDAEAYIELAKQFLGTSASNVDLSYRQPLYSLLLAPFIFVFGDNGLFFPVMVLQFFMILISSLTIYKIFERIKPNSYLALFTGIAYLINVSTIHYGFTLLTETLSLLIFVTIVHLVVKSMEIKKLWVYAALGTLNALIVLARFNAIGVPLVTFIIMGLIHYKLNGFSNFKNFLKHSIAYIIPFLFVLNLWSLYNLNNRGFYGLFPSYHAGQRWAIPTTISEKNSVSDEYKPLLEIFLRARAEFIENEPPVEKKRGSLLKYQFIKKIYDILHPEINGFKVYGLAQPALLEYYKLGSTPEDIVKLGPLLKPFYDEIARQNFRQLLQLRIFSLFETFRASASTLPGEVKLNLNVLPTLVFNIYKIIFFLISIITFVLVGAYLVKWIWKLKQIENMGIMILSIFIWYFPLVHFYSNVLGDANRFKYPAEPLIIGIFIYYVSLIINKLNRKNLNLIH